MPRISKNGTEQNEEGLENKVEDFLSSISITTQPVVICGVNRRKGLAHFEHIDIYAGIAIPLNVNTDNLEELRIAVAKAAEFGFNTVSGETWERYNLLAEAEKNA